FLATIYWITKGILQIPISYMLDKHEGEKDDFYALVFGLMIIALTAFSFMIAKTITQVYVVQLLKAVGFALYIPAWSSIFSRHLDRNHTALEWAIDSSTVSFGIGIAGFLGGTIASAFGFNILFLMVGIAALISAAVLLFVPDLILPRKTIMKPQMLDHAQTGIK
ncbi:MAG: MFS transporter, partial [Patescibacteria group bacterium]|nr:MFS transporter [Patescibacteria group bacterium]